MIILWLILAVIAVIVFVFVKLEHHMRLFKFGIIAFVILMLFFSMSTMFNSDVVDLSSPQGVINGVYMYIGWLGQTMSELWAVGIDTGKTVGNVIKVDKEDETEFGGTNFSFRDKIANLIRKN